MRLFLAIPIPDDLKKEIKRYQKTIAHLPLRMTPDENMHVTLVFLGETPESELPFIEQKICRSLTSTKRSLTSFTFIPEKFGPGPDPRRPRLLWLTMKASQGVLALQKELARVLEREEKRTFTAHVTVARFNQPTFDVQKLKTNTGTSNVEKLASLVTELHLIQSRLERSGAKYRTVKVFPLVNR